MTDMTVIGLGYVGLPLAFAETGADIIGIDTNPEKLTSLNQGISYVEDAPPTFRERAAVQRKVARR